MASEFRRPVTFLIGVYGERGLLLMINVATKVAGCVHATTLTKLALVDSVDHTLKTLPSFFPAVVVDDTQFQASHQVSLFMEHGREVARLEVSSKKLEIVTNDERIHTDVRNNKEHAVALRTCTRNLGADCACGGKRMGVKVMAMRAKRFRVKMTSMKRLRQGEPRWRGLSRRPPSPL